jgi:tetratricopeptide (TPR) repeat protein
VEFVRAITLQHVRKFDEAHEVLAECRAVFNEHGDTTLFTKCTLAHGNLLIRRGDYASAREALSSIVTSNTDTSPRAHLALGWCALHLGDPRAALSHFTTAAALFTNQPVEAIRASYGTGAALLRLGVLDDALQHLSQARTRFLNYGLVEEAGLSGLEMVEAHVLRADAETAKTLAASVASEFAVANLNHRALVALAYLNDAIAASSATPEVVRSVNTYIASLHMDPTREFVVVN